MTQENKELLLKDLCGRLPYGVHIYTKMNNSPISARMMLDFYHIQMLNQNKFEFIKPYLFPLSSMTEEQKKECNFADDLDIDILDAALCTNHYHKTGIPTVTYNLVDWCNENHFDYRGLIIMGLANDATGLNIY